VEELRLKLPKVFIPHHLFQVLHVGVGKASGAVPFNLESINNCMISWGKVVDLKDTDITVNLTSLEKSDGGYMLVQKKCRAKAIDGFLPNLKSGDTVAVHWNQAIKILTLKEAEQLAYWTKKVLENVD
jgi:hydrogenase maturation factor